MSCESENSHNGRSALKWLFLLLFGALLLANAKEIARYIKISSM